MAPSPAPSVAPLVNLPKSIATYVSDVVSVFHKEAALVMGVLVALGVTPTPAANSKVTSGLLIGYAAVAQLAEKLFGKPVA